MKRLVIGMILALLLSVWFLNFTGTIEFGVGEMIARLWSLIPIYIGVRILRIKKQARVKTGLVMVIFGSVFLILEIIAFFAETQEIIFTLAGLAFLFYWPAALLMIAGTIVYSIVSKGEEVYTAFLLPRHWEGERWTVEDSTLIALLTKNSLRITKDQLNFRILRLDLLGLGGKLVVEVPEDVSVMLEAKQRLGRFQFFDQPSTKLLGSETVEEPVPDVMNVPRLLITTSSWLTTVEVRRTNS